LLLPPSFASSDSSPFEFAANFRRSIPANSPSLKQAELLDDAVCFENSLRVKFPTRQEKTGDPIAGRGEMIQTLR
jgi:hypothetical protein